MSRGVIQAWDARTAADSCIALDVFKGEMTKSPQAPDVVLGGVSGAQKPFFSGPLNEGLRPDVGRGLPPGACKCSEES